MSLYLNIVNQKKIKLMRSGCIIGIGLWLMGSLSTLLGGPVLLEIFLSGAAFAATSGGWASARML